MESNAPSIGANESNASNESTPGLRPSSTRPRTRLGEVRVTVKVRGRGRVGVRVRVRVSSSHPYLGRGGRRSAQPCVDVLPRESISWYQKCCPDLAARRDARTSRRSPVSTSLPLDALPLAHGEEDPLVNN